ncbi:MAG: HU family DNA-binding protein [Bacillota bacterium]|nr:HU family DNA-binding protein [Bacillota bacterium]
MNKMDLVTEVAKRAEITKKAAGKAVDAVFDVIAGTVASGEKVQVIGFGSFEPRERKERKGRNPQTGEEIIIPATTTVSFKPGKQLKESVAG